MKKGMLSLCNFADSEILADSQNVPDRFHQQQTSSEISPAVTISAPFFTQKLKFHLPKFDRKHYLGLFYNLNINYTYIQWIFYSIHKFTNNNMLNSISELYNLKLEKVNPTLTLDWLITRFYKLSLLWLVSSLGFLPFLPKACFT